MVHGVGVEAGPGAGVEELVVHLVTVPPAAVHGLGVGPLVDEEEDHLIREDEEEDVKDLMGGDVFVGSHGDQVAGEGGVVDVHLGVSGGHEEVSPNHKPIIHCELQRGVGSGGESVSLVLILHVAVAVFSVAMPALPWLRICSA